MRGLERSLKRRDVYAELGQKRCLVTNVVVLVSLIICTSRPVQKHVAIVDQAAYLPLQQGPEFVTERVA